MTAVADASVVGIVPQGDRVLIRCEESAAMSPGGIHLPDQSQEKSDKGIVMATGPGPRLANGERAPMGIEQGQKVFFSPYAGTSVDWNGETFLLLREEDILAICFD